MSSTPRSYVICLVVLLVFSFLIRLIGWDDPYFGFHIGRQITSLNSIDAYARDGVDFLRVGGSSFLASDRPRTGARSRALLRSGISREEDAASGRPLGDGS